MGGQSGIYIFQPAPPLQGESLRSTFNTGHSHTREKLHIFFKRKSLTLLCNLNFPDLINVCKKQGYLKIVTEACEFWTPDDCAIISSPPQVYLEISKKVSSGMRVLSFYLPHWQFKFQLHYLTRGASYCCLSIAASRIIPKLSGLKQQQPFSYFSTFLWVGSLRRAWLVQYLLIWLKWDRG